MKGILKKMKALPIALMGILYSSKVFAVDFNPKSIEAKDVDGLDNVTNLGGQIITIISTIGSIVSVVILIILGLKYMMGSAEEKAEYKKTLLPYIIGAGLVFAASAIAGIVFSFMQNLGGAA